MRGDMRLHAGQPRSWNNGIRPEHHDALGGRKCSGRADVTMFARNRHPRTAVTAVVHRDHKRVRAGICRLRPVVLTIVADADEQQGQSKQCTNVTPPKGKPRGVRR